MLMPECTIFAIIIIKPFFSLRVRVRRKSGVESTDTRLDLVLGQKTKPQHKGEAE